MKKIETDRERFIKINADKLYKISRQINTIQFSLDKDVTVKRRGNLFAELDKCWMHYHQTGEKLGFALGFLSLDDLRDEYVLNGFQTYQGVKDQLSKIEFTN